MQYPVIYRGCILRANLFLDSKRTPHKNHPYGTGIGEMTLFTNKEVHVIFSCPIISDLESSGMAFVI